MVGLLNTRTEYGRTYDFNDIATGTGINRYYGIAVSGGALNVSDYLLSDQLTYSGKVVLVISGVAMPGDAAKPYKQVQTHDFDIPMNKPMIVEGNGIVNVTHGMKNCRTSNTNLGSMMAAIFKKVNSAGTETEIISGSTMFNKTLVAKTGFASETGAIKLVIPKTKFRATDTLRVTMIQLGQNVGGNDTGVFSWGYSCDPEDRDDDDTNQHIEDADTTQLIVDIPFKIKE